ncbi:MAG: hypothetical protein KUG81_09725 [Gammaproteobacteria bacterium]|nr:hypothetical protein [Gammaproteobacteria bacterium]
MLFKINHSFVLYFFFNMARTKMSKSRSIKSKSKKKRPIRKAPEFDTVVVPQAGVTQPKTKFKRKTRKRAVIEKVMDNPALKEKRLSFRDKGVRQAMKKELKKIKKAGVIRRTSTTR